MEARDGMDKVEELTQPVWIVRIGGGGGNWMA